MRVCALVLTFWYVFMNLLCFHFSALSKRLGCPSATGQCQCFSLARASALSNLSNYKFIQVTTDFQGSWWYFSLKWDKEIKKNLRGDACGVSTVVGWTAGSYNRISCHVRRIRACSNRERSDNSLPTPAPLGNVPYMSKFVLDVRNDAVEFRNYIYILQKESNKRHNFVFFKLLGGGDIVHPLVPFTAKRKTKRYSKRQAKLSNVSEWFDASRPPPRAQKNRLWICTNYF